MLRKMKRKDGTWIEIATRTMGEALSGPSLDLPSRVCECCGKPLGELKPFGNFDAVEDDFTDVLLAKNYRPSLLSAQNADSSWECRDCFTLDEDEYFEKLEESGRFGFIAVPAEKG